MSVMKIIIEKEFWRRKKSLHVKQLKVLELVSVEIRLSFTLTWRGDINDSFSFLII